MIAILKNILYNPKTQLRVFKRKSSSKNQNDYFCFCMRIRSSLSFQIHKFFQEKGFYYINTPIITGSDAEGAGKCSSKHIKFKKTPLNDLEMLILKRFFWEGNQSYGLWSIGSRSLCSWPW